MLHKMIHISKKNKIANCVLCKRIQIDKKQDCKLCFMQEGTDN